MTKRGRQRGYEAEAAIAKYLNIERIAGSGRRDLDGDWFSLEVKERGTIVKWLTDAVAQARRLARLEQLPAVAIHFLGQEHRDDIVCLTLADFAQHRKQYEILRAEVERLYARIREMEEER